MVNNSVCMLVCVCVCVCVSVVVGLHVVPRAEALMPSWPSAYTGVTVTLYWVSDSKG